MPRSPRPVRATLILMAAVVLAAIPAAVAARGVASAPRPAPRERASLPGVAVSHGPASPLNPIVSPTDTFLVAGFGFEDRLGICRTRGWTGEDRAGRIYDDAARHFRALARLSPEAPAPHEALGKVYRDQGLMDMAAAEFQQALALTRQP